MSAFEHIERELKDRDVRLKTKYTCMVCGVGDLSHDAISPFAYVVGNDGTNDRIPSEKFTVCSEPCRRELIIRNGAPYYTVMRDGIEKYVIPRRNLQDPYSRLKAWADSDNLITKNIHEQITHWLFNPNHGWLLFGNMGTGKTSAACVMAHELRKREKIVLFTTGYQLTTETQCLNNSSRSFDIKEDTEAFMHKYMHNDVLIIDELSDLNYTVNPTLITNLFLQLYAENKMLILTSNSDLEQIKKIMDARVMSRLMQMCQPLLFEGKDLR